MSKNRQKSSHSNHASDTSDEAALGARTISIPRPSEQAMNPSEDPVIVPQLEAEPEAPTRQKPIVVLQEPKTPASQQNKPVSRQQKQINPNERIGDILRNARQAHGYELYPIAEYLRIKPAFLLALENSRYDEFPADAYVIGFLKSYANLLGVDVKEAVDRYRYEMAGRRKKPILLMPTPVSEGRAPSAVVLIGVAFAVFLIYVLWYGVSSSNRAEIHTPPPLPVTTQAVPELPPIDGTSAAGLTAPVTTTVETPAPAVSAPPALAAAPAPTTPPPIPPEAPGIMVSGNTPAAALVKDELTNNPPPAVADDKTPAAKDAKDAPAAKDLPVPLTDTAAKDVKKADPEKAKDADSTDGKQVFGDAKANARLVIRAKQSSWIMVTDDSGRTVFDHVLKPGESYKVPNEPGLSLTTGNGAGIVLSLDGTDLPKVASGPPHVVRNISLDPDHVAGESANSDR